MHVKAAVAGDVAGEHVGECDINNASRRAGIAHIEREQTARSQHGASLMLDDAWRQREWRAPRLTECPRSCTQRLRVKAGSGMARERAVEAKDGGDADDQLRMARRETGGRCDARSERRRRIAEQNVAITKQHIERRSGARRGQRAFAIGQYFERKCFGAGVAQCVKRIRSQARNRRAHARQQPAGVGGGNAAARPFEYAHAWHVRYCSCHGAHHSG